MGTVSRVAVVFAAYILLAVLCTWPGVARPGRLIGDGGDNIEYYSYILIAQDNILRGRYVFADTCVYRYPDCYRFSLGSDAKAFVALGGALSVLLPPPVVYNGLIVLFLAVNALSAFAFLYMLTGNQGAAFVSGLAYGMSYWSLANGYGYTNLMQTFGFPVLGIAALYIRRGRIVAGVRAAALSFVLAIFSAVQYAAIVVISVVFGAALYAAFFPSKTWSLFRRAIYHRVQILVSLGAAVLIVVPVFWAHADALFYRQGDIPRVYESLTLHAAFLRPSEYVRTALSEFVSERFSAGVFAQELNSIRRSQFIGYVEALLFIVFIFAERSRRALIIILLSAMYYVCILGLSHNGYSLPYTYISGLFPFSVILETERWFAAGYLVVISGMALGLSRLSTRFGPGIIIATLLFVYAERATVNYRTSPVPHDPYYAELVRSFPGTAVLDIPVITDFPVSWMRSSYNHLPFVYKKNIISGYFHWLPDNLYGSPFITNNPQIRMFTCTQKPKQYTDALAQSKETESLQALLRTHDIRTVVVHMNVLNSRPCTSLRMGMRDFFDSPASGFMKKYQDDDVVIYIL